MFLLKSLTLRLHRSTLQFSVSNALERPITFARISLSLLSMEHHVLIFYRERGLVLWFGRKSARYLESLGSINELIWVWISFSNIFEKLERTLWGHNYFCVFYGAVSTYFKIWGKFPLVKQLLKIFVKAWEYTWTEFTLILTWLSLKVMALDKGSFLMKFMILFCFGFWKV